MAAFPPTYKNGYERLYRFVDDSTEWERPSYDIWDPAKIDDWIDELDARYPRRLRQKLHLSVCSDLPDHRF